jgi:hypothetical protein
MAQALYQLRLRVEAWTEATIEDGRDRSEWIVKDTARLATQGPHAYLAQCRTEYDSYCTFVVDRELEDILGRGGEG